MFIIALYPTNKYKIYTESLLLYDEYKCKIPEIEYINNNNIKKEFNNYCKLNSILKFREIINNLSKNLPFNISNNFYLFNIKITTIIYIDIDNYSNKYINNLSLFKINIRYTYITSRYHSRNSIIRIARFKNSFGADLNNYYYYSDIYMNIFSRNIKSKIKNKLIKKKINLILILQNKVSSDIIRYILKFLSKYLR